MGMLSKFLGAASGLSAQRAIFSKTVNVKLKGEGGQPSPLKKLGTDLLRAAEVLAERFEHRWGPSPLRFKVGERMLGAYLILLLSASLPASLFWWAGHRAMKRIRANPQSVNVAPSGSAKGAEKAPGGGTDASN